MATKNGEGVHLDYRVDNQKNKNLKKFIKGLASATTYGLSDKIGEKLGSAKNVTSAWKNLSANLKQDDVKYSNESSARSDELITAIKKQNKVRKAKQQGEYDKTYRGADFMSKVRDEVANPLNYVKRKK